MVRACSRIRPRWAEPCRREDLRHGAYVFPRSAQASGTNSKDVWRHGQGYGPGVVEEFLPTKMGASKHVLALDDGPRREKMCLRRKGNGKVPWLHKSVMATAYRRKREGLTHREPWSQNSRTLSRALTSAEANTMWSSFDAGLNEDHNLFRLMDAEGNVTPRSNAVDDSDPSKPMGLRLQSGTARSPRPAEADSPVKLGQMRGRHMSRSAPLIGASSVWGGTQPAVSVASDIHVRV